MRIHKAAIATAFIAAMTNCQATAQNDIVAIKGVTIYANPDAGPLHDGVILIEDGVIIALGEKDSVAIPANAEMLPCDQCAVTAGLWNSHAHFFERKWIDAASAPAEELDAQLQDMFTQFGFTSVFDLSSDLQNTKALRDRIDSGELNGPHIRATGEGLVAPGALPPDQVLSMMGLMKTPLPEIADIAAASRAATDLINQGADGVKLFAGREGAPLPDGAMDAVIAATHARNKPVFIHPNDGDDVLQALEAGADVITHTTPHSGSWPDAVFEAVSLNRPALTPTLSLWTYYARHDRAGIGAAIAETAANQLRGWIAAGGIVLFGADAGANQYNPQTEYALMRQSGMSFPEILASMTTAPAKYYGGDEDLGVIKIGGVADLAIFGGDPASNITALTDIRYTIRGGKILYARASSN